MSRHASEESNVGRLRGAYRSCAIILLNTAVLFIALEIATRLLLP